MRRLFPYSNLRHETAFEKAVRLVRHEVRVISDGTVDFKDLPDTFNLAAGLSELEDAIDNAGSFGTAIGLRSDITELAFDIASQLLEESEMMA